MFIICIETLAYRLNIIGVHLENSAYDVCDALNLGGPFFFLFFRHCPSLSRQNSPVTHAPLS